MDNEKRIQELERKVELLIDANCRLGMEHTALKLVISALLPLIQYDRADAAEALDKSEIGSDDSNFQDADPEDLERIHRELAHLTERALRPFGRYFPWRPPKGHY